MSNYLRYRGTGVSPVSSMVVLAMVFDVCTGGTPVILMGKMPMLRSEIVTQNVSPFSITKESGHDSQE
jgi:hypothetical protein